MANFPKSVTFYKQRKIFGGFTLAPSRIVMSKVGDFDDFTLGDEPDDAIDIELASSTEERIHALLSLRGVGILSNTSEWWNNARAVLTPASVDLDKVSQNGSSASVPPVVGSNNIIFASSSGKDIKQLVYNFQTDSWVPTSLIALAAHLFDSPAKRLAYVPGTVNTLAVLQDDGALNVLFLGEGGIYAWTEWTTNGTWLDIDSAENGFWVAVDRSGPKIEFISLEGTALTDAGSNYVVEVETLPIENSVVGLHNKATASDLFVKLLNTGSFQYTVGDAPLATYAATGTDSGTHQLTLPSEWGLDKTIRLRQENSSPFELLSYTVLGRVGQDEYPPNSRQQGPVEEQAGRGN